MRDLNQDRYGIGDRPARKEDPDLLRGRGRYTDDISAAGEVYAAMFRSDQAHGIIRSIDASAATSMPGVLGVFTGRDLAAGGCRPMPRGVSVKNHDGSDMPWPEWRALPEDRVLHVGQAVACVVAETKALASEAAEAVIVEIDPLPVVTTPAEAILPGAPQLHPGIPGNVVAHYRTGDRAGVAAAFSQAAHVARLSLVNSRIIVNPMEPRSAIATYDPEADRYTLQTGTQGVVVTRGQAAAALGVPPEKLRVLTGNVGGSFGMKAHPFPEDICVLFAAKRFGRPVKWTETRSASFVADSHGRAHDMTIELALDADGRFLALRLTGFGNLGAYLTQGGIIPATINVTRNTVSVYRTPLIEVDTRCVFTNTSPVGAYRGNGRPEANYYVERVIDTAAREMGIDPIELRRRNHIRPEDLPYKAPSGLAYDSGDFTGVLDRAVELSDWHGFAARKADSERRGKLRGRGIGQFLEVTGIPTNEMGGVSFDPDGGVTILTGTMDNGQGHPSAFAQVVVSLLGIPFDKIRLHQGDSDRLIAGAGSGGSRSLIASGAAFVEASARIIEKGRLAAAHFLEADAADIEFRAGDFTIVGTGRKVGIIELAAMLRALPAGSGADLPETLDTAVVFRDGTPAFPNGCHVAEIEIDPDTGTAAVVRYASVGDFGNIVNPAIVEGQLHGGIVQGIGQALSERAVYDASGQLLTGSFMDYAMPRASDVPDLVFASRPEPALTNPLGVKGCGEAGCAGALGSVMNAVVDALAPLGVRHIDMPATPERIWNALQASKGAGRGTS